MGAAAAATYICLSFSFSACALFSSPLPYFLRKSPQRGCFLHEWERATAVLGTAVGRPYSLSSHFWCVIRKLDDAVTRFFLLPEVHSHLVLSQSLSAFFPLCSLPSLFSPSHEDGDPKCSLSFLFVCFNEDFHCRVCSSVACLLKFYPSSLCLQQ